MVKIRYCLYFALLFAAIFMSLWIKHGWEVKKFGIMAVRPLVEMHMRYALRNDNIVLSLTTTPYRINKLQPILETLYAQNVKINSIYLSIPYVFKRDNIKYNIPQWLSEDPRITILRTEDFGPATKLLGALEKINFPKNTILITVDDDMYYPDNLILHLAYEAKIHPDDVITTIGSNMDYDENGKLKTTGIGTVTSFDPNGIVSVVLGFSGVAYRPEFFDREIFKLEQSPQECVMIDDFYISFHLARRGIARRNLRDLYVSHEEIECHHKLAFQPESLFIITPNRAITTGICLNYLLSRYPNVQV